MANLKYGSTGTEVKDLQQKLIDAGYGDTVGKADGVFGAKTQKAVTEYQKANGLTVDGIAGKNTLGSLNSGNAGSALAQGVVNGAKQAAGGTAGGNADGGAKNTGSDTSGTTGSSTFTYGSYADMKSDVVKEAEAILAQYGSTKPGEWVDPYKDKYMGYLNQYENRDPFSYDFNNDPLYQQYRDQYTQQGQLAMMDAMGQAAALNGGYGSSYAQTVGQQTYNQQLGQLNEMMPELYQMAYDQYGREGQQMLDMFNMYLGLSEQDYSQYQAGLENWYREYDRLASNANTEYQRDYSDYTTGRSEAFSEHQTAQSQAFTASEAQKSRDFTASENEKSRKASATKSSGTTANTPTYTKWTGSEAKYWNTQLERAETSGALNEISYELLAAGFDPEFVKQKIQARAKALGLLGTTTTDTTVSPTGKPSIGTGGGGGGGTWYLETR